MAYDPLTESLTGVWQELACGNQCISPIITGSIELYRLAFKGRSTFCPGEPINLEVTGRNVRWYASSTATTPIRTGNTYSPAITATTTYYVTQTVNNTESPRLPITVTVGGDRSRWNGSQDTRWDNPANWDCGLVPTIDRQVEIPGGMPNMPNITINNAACNNIEIAPTAALTISNNGRLSVRGDFDNAGQLNHESGVVVFLNGSNVHQIRGRSTFHRIEVSGCDYLAFVDPTQVRESFKFDCGRIFSDGNLTLLSTQTSSAAILLDLNSETPGGEDEIFGAVNVQRYVENYTPRPAGLGYTYFSSPVQGARVETFAPVMSLVYDNPADPYYWFNLAYRASNFPNFFKYVEGENAIFEGGAAPQAGWRAVAAGEALTVGRGYCVNLAGGSLVTFTGRVNAGAQQIPVTRGSAAASGWNLVGNPYPTPIDWEAVYALGGNSALVERTIYRRVAVGQYTGTWAYYPAGSPVGGINGSKDIALGQGFFVRALANGNLRMDKSVRLGGYQNPRFYRPEETEALGLAGALKLEVANASQADQTVLVLAPGAVAGLDGRDVEKAFANAATSPELFTRSAEGSKLAFNYLPAISEHLSVPLYFRAGQAGRHEFRLAEAKFLGANDEVLIEDRTTGQWHPIRRQAYAFTAPAGEQPGRFVLHLRRGEAGPVPTGYLNAYPNPLAGGRLNLALRHDYQGTANLRLATPQGQVVLEQAVAKPAEFLNTSVDVAALPPGLYLLTLDLGGQVLTQRFTKQ
ncbi:MAG: T9SS type A sorting domain-containing protein [Bernardetiaceae bacterium]|nr:T9SS type A sorting domain-containing protein [Bernardetiaceae bacterium]